MTRERMFKQRANAEGDQSRKRSTHSGPRGREARPNGQRMTNGCNLSLRADNAVFDQAPRFFGGRKGESFIDMMLRRPHRHQTDWHCQRANPIGHRVQRAEEQQGSDRESCGRTHQTPHYTAALDFSWGFFGMSDTFEAESLYATPHPTAPRRFRFCRRSAPSGASGLWRYPGNGPRPAGQRAGRCGRLDGRF